MILKTLYIEDYSDYLFNILEIKKEIEINIKKSNIQDDQVYENKEDNYTD